MRLPVIKEWLTAEELLRWLQNASDKETHRRRLVIWLTYTGKISAAEVGRLVGVSKQAVWLWLSQYNKYGPQGLERQGRGGRRWGFLTVEQEAKLIGFFIEKVKAGQCIRPVMIKEAIEKQLNKKVSMSYVYRLLERRRWSAMIGKFVPVRKQMPSVYSSFQKISRPWLRDKP